MIPMEAEHDETFASPDADSGFVDGMKGARRAPAPPKPPAIETSDGAKRAPVPPPRASSSDVTAETSAREERTSSGSSDATPPAKPDSTDGE